MDTNQFKTEFSTFSDSENLTDFSVLETVRSEIHAEHTLISHRMNWYVTSQSFLVAAFAISFSQNYRGIGFFSWSVPVLGIILSLGAFLAISSAIIVQNSVIKLQEDMVKALQDVYKETKDKTRLDCYAEITCASRPTGNAYHVIAMFVPRALPIIFIVGWILALVYAVNIAKIQ